MKSIKTKITVAIVFCSLISAVVISLLSISNSRDLSVTDAEKELTLADLPVGATGVIVKIMPGMRGRKKFADVGLVAGARLQMEAHAPFGSLLRVRVLETSMALHRDDAAKIIMKPEGN